MVEKGQTPSYIVKIIMLGFTRAGKTALLKKYLDGSFPNKYTPTQPMNLENKRITVGENLVQASIWDIGSQMGYDTLLPLYYKGALGALLVFDLTKKKSLEVIPKFINELSKYAPGIPISLIANKKDLVEDREITQEEIDEILEKIRKEWNQKVTYFETSAKDPQEKIAVIFEDLIQNIIHEKIENIEDEIFI